MKYGCRETMVLSVLQLKLPLSLKDYTCVSKDYNHIALNQRVGFLIIKSRFKTEIQGPPGAPGMFAE